MDKFATPGLARPNDVLVTEWAALFLRLLGERGPLTVMEVCDHLNLTHSSVSYRLERLKTAGLLVVQKVRTPKLVRIYRLADQKFDAEALPAKPKERKERARAVALTLSTVARQYAVALEKGRLEDGAKRTLRIDRKPIRLSSEELETVNELIDKFLRDLERLSDSSGELVGITVTMA